MLLKGVGNDTHSRSHSHWKCEREGLKRGAKSFLPFLRCQIMWQNPLNYVAQKRGGESTPMLTPCSLTLVQNFNPINLDLNSSFIFGAYFFAKIMTEYCSNMWRLARVDCKIFTKKRERISKNQEGNPEWAKPTRDCPRGFWIFSRVFE